MNVQRLVRRTRAATRVDDDLVDEWAELRATDPASAAAALDRLTNRAANRVAFALARRQLRPNAERRPHVEAPVRPDASHSRLEERESRRRGRE